MVSNCSVFLENLHRLPMYDTKDAVEDVYRKRYLIEKIHDYHAGYSGENLTFTSDTIIPLEQLIIDSKLSANDSEWDSWMKSWSSEKLGYNEHQLYKKTSVKTLNEQMTKAIQTCLENAKDGLHAQVLLDPSDWRKFLLKIDFRSFRLDDHIDDIVLEYDEENLSPRSISDGDRLEGREIFSARDDGTYSIKNGQTRYLAFERKLNRSEVILLRPANPATGNWSDIPIAVEQSMRAKRRFKGHVRVITTFHSSNSQGDAREYIEELDLPKDGETTQHPLRDEKNPEKGCYVRLTKHAAPRVGFYAQGLVIDRTPGITQVSATTPPANSFGKISAKAALRGNESHAAIQVQMLTDYLVVPADEYEVDEEKAKDTGLLEDLEAGAIYLFDNRFDD